MQSFEDALTSQFNLEPNLKHAHRDVWRILAEPDGRRKHRQLLAMESNVRLHQNLPDMSVTFDWSSVDWGAILLDVLKVLAALLPFLLLL